MSTGTTEGKMYGRRYLDKLDVVEKCSVLCHYDVPLEEIMVHCLNDIETRLQGESIEHRPFGNATSVRYTTLGSDLTRGLSRLMKGTPHRKSFVEIGIMWIYPSLQTSHFGIFSPSRDLGVAACKAATPHTTANHRLSLPCSVTVI